MKKKTVTFICAALTFCLLILCFTACTTFEKIKDDIIDKVNDVVAIDDKGTSFYEGNTYEMPGAMTFRLANNTPKTVRLTASVYPASASDKSVDWTLSWVNANSSWATGKTVSNYVTVTPTSDGSLTADVACLQSFGEQVKIVVTSRSNEFAFAECTVDYLADVSNVSFVISDASSYTFTFDNSGICGDLQYFGKNARNSFDSTERIITNTLTPVFSGAYTIQDTVTSYRVFIKDSSEYLTNLGNTDFSPVADSVSKMQGDFTEYVELTNTSSGPLANSGYTNNSYITGVDFISVFSGKNLTSNSFENTVYLNCFNPMKTALASTSGAHFSVKIVATFQNAGNLTFEYAMRFTNSSLGLTATSVTLNQNSLTF